MRRPKSRLAPLLPTACALLAAGAPPANAQPLPSSVVAYTGQTAPGTGGAIYFLLYQPTITADGDVTFRAELTGAGVDGTNHKGYWRLAGGNPVTLLLRAGAASPLPGTTFGVDVADATTQAVASSPRAGFAWDVLDGGPSERVLWSEQGGGLRAVARMGDPLPEIAGATFTGLPLFDTKFDELGRLAFIGGFAGPGITTANDSAVFVDDGANRTIVVREGDDVPGLPAGTVFPSIVSTGVSLAPGSDVTFHSAPFVASQGLFIDGIWSNRSGSLAPVVLEGGTAPGLGPGETLFPGIPFANRNGQIAFGALIQGGAGGWGLWISDAGGSPALAYRLPAVDPPFSFSGTHTFLADNGVFYMITHRNVAGGSRQAILAIGPSGWREVAHVGARVANLPAGVVYQLFDQLLVNANGQVAFRATIAGPGVTSTNNKVLVAHGADGAFHLVARTGDSIEVAPGVVRTLFGLLIPQDVAGGPGVARGFSDTGSLVWVAQTGGISSAILITNAGVPPPVELVGLEAVQVVQDWGGSVPLVEGKQTWVRAYFQSSSPVAIHPRLRAYETSGGPELPFSPLAPVDAGAGLAQPDVTAQRGQLAASSEWRLPIDWTLGDVELEVELLDRPLECFDAAPPTPNDCRVSMSFGGVERPRVRFVSIDYLHTTNGLQSVSPERRLELARRLVSALPIDAVDWSGSVARWPAPVPPDVPSCFLWQWMRARRLLDGCDEGITCKTIYYGVALGDRIDGCAGIGGWSGAGYMPRDPLAAGRQTHTHEFAHNLWRDHTVDPLLLPLPNGRLPGFCGESAEPGTPEFPYIAEIGGLRRPTLGPMASGENAKIFGFDTLQERIVAPDRFFDLMSYCQFSGIHFWPSKDTYAWLRAEIDNRFTPLVAPVPQAGRGPAAELLVHGWIDPELGSATFDPFLSLPASGLLAAPAPGPYTLRVHRDGGGSEDLAFAPTVLAAEFEQPTLLPFFLAVSSPATIASVELLEGAQQLAVRAASANAPSVQVLAPNGGELLDQASVELSWAASDADGDPLHFVVQFSADGGATWTTLESNATATTLEIPRAALAGTADGRLRVQATDGLRTSSDDSDAAFTVVDNPPQVSILLPGGGALFFDGQVLTLEGAALDPEDGLLEGAALQWSSSLDGPLGSGSPLSLPVESLEEGLHTVTLTAEDSEGNVAQAVVQIRVDEPALLFEDDFESGGTTLWD